MSRHVTTRFKKHSRKQPEEEGLLVFGYSSRIYPNDSRSELIAGESHLQPWPMDESILIDRFDVRLLLSTQPSECKGKVELSGEEAKEERHCEEERWHALHEAELASLKRVEEEDRPKKAEFSFSYEQPSVVPSKVVVEDEDDSDEEEPFVPPPGIKLPLGLETPVNQKLNHVIERTAVFVVKQGPQMEIVIKAKQRTNQEQFGFLHFDHILNPYYKYIMKLIREGKYSPDIESKKKKTVGNGSTQQEDKNGVAGEGGGQGGASGNALTALMAQHGSDSDSDSDCELHPSLLAGSRRGGSPDPVEKGERAFAGPQKRPMSPPPAVMRTDYSIQTANDAYSTLFKNLTMINVTREKEQEEVERVERAEKEEKKEIEGVISREEESDQSHREWDDFTDWFISFYGMSPPLPFCNMPYIPPPPDMEKALTGYARYVGENGAEAEFALKGRVELQLHFLTPSNPHHLYYLSAVRRAQWEKEKKETEAMTSAVVPPPPPLNRKQRRMAFMDAPQVSTAPLPSVVDPAALILAAAALPHSYETSMTKSASSPVLLSTVTSSPSYSSPLPMSPAPVPPSPFPPSVGDGNSGLVLLPCPVPPNISTLSGPSQIAKPKEIMTERQLKARLFMEKIMNDKRKKKEDETTKGVEGMEEGEIVESEEKEGRRGRREERESREDREGRREKEKDTKDEKKAVSTSFIDNLIKSKMNALLKETVPGSLAVEKKNEEIKESKRAEDEKERKEKDDRREKGKKEEKREKEREERKRKKEKKEKKRRSRSRSGSDEERRRRRRRSRSASSDLPSKYRRR